jgi:mercuric ion transport protein
VIAMNDRKLLGIGIGGAALTALCCFTPLPVLVLGALGLGAWLGWLDSVLLPLLVLFLALAAYAALRRHARRGRP